MGLTEAAPPLAAWGLTADLAPLTRGYRNTVLRTTGDSPAWVFKTTRRASEALLSLTPVQDAAEAVDLLSARIRPARPRGDIDLSLMPADIAETCRAAWRAA